MDGVIESGGGNLELPGEPQHLLRITVQQGHLSGDEQSPEQSTAPVDRRGIRSPRIECQCTRPRQGTLGCIAGLLGLMLEELVDRRFLGEGFDLEHGVAGAPVARSAPMEPCFSGPGELERGFRRAQRCACRPVPVALGRCAFRPASQCFFVLSEVGRQRRDTFAKSLRPDGSRANAVRDGRKPGERADLEPA
jgi:hypothetical protein